MCFSGFWKKKIKSRGFRDERCKVERRRKGIHGLRGLSGIPLGPSQVSQGNCTHLCWVSKETPTSWVVTRHHNLVAHNNGNMLSEIWGPGFQSK